MSTTATRHSPHTSHPRLAAWVDEVAELTQPRDVHWVTGSPEEWTELTDALVAAGTFVRLDESKKPNSFYCKSDPSDVARVEGRTFICSAQEKDAGPTNNWMDPDEMKGRLTELYRGCMQGRTMYVIPFVMGHIDATVPMFGVEVTDSAYVVVSMLVMARCGTEVLRAIEDQDADYVPALHSVGAPLADGRDRRRRGRARTRSTSSSSPRSGRSGATAPATAATPCSARSARAAHRLGDRPRRGLAGRAHAHPQAHLPAGKVHTIAAAFPSACGKTNLAMITPTIPGWKAEMVGDDIAWMRFGPDGRLYAVNPEFGLFGVAPGTGESTNPQAMAPSPRATPSSPTSPSPTTATSGGRA